MIIGPTFISDIVIEIRQFLFPQRIQVVRKHRKVRSQILHVEFGITLVGDSLEGPAGLIE